MEEKSTQSPLMPTPKSNFLEKQNFSASFSTQTFQQEKKPKKKIDEGIDRKKPTKIFIDFQECCGNIP